MTVAPPSTPSVYTIAVDKTRHEVYVLEETKDHYRIVKSYPADFGRERGDKVVQGDLKTPEGMYYITTIKREQELAAQYGPRAYVLNYPNDVDRAQGKTGYGIWIHGSGIGSATRPSEGCVVVGDRDVAALEQFTACASPSILISRYSTPRASSTRLAARQSGHQSAE
ncbi:MAG: L,D-transpeptidase family protein [Nitrospinae bacterium]|nr:L,D-transpeptidase family protein [Nitrospinota bacterium]